MVLTFYFGALGVGNERDTPFPRRLGRGVLGDYRGRWQFARWSLGEVTSRRTLPRAGGD